MLATRSLLRSPRLPGLVLAAKPFSRFVSNEPHSYQPHPAGQSQAMSLTVVLSTLNTFAKDRSDPYGVKRRFKFACSTLEALEASRTIPTLTPGVYRERSRRSQSRLPPATDLRRQVGQRPCQFLKKRLRFRYRLQGELQPQLLSHVVPRR